MWAIVCSTSACTGARQNVSLRSGIKTRLDSRRCSALRWYFYYTVIVGAFTCAIHITPVKLPSIQTILTGLLRNCYCCNDWSLPTVFRARLTRPMEIFLCLMKSKGSFCLCIKLLTRKISMNLFIRGLRYMFYAISQSELNCFKEHTLQAIYFKTNCSLLKENAFKNGLGKSLIV